MVDLRNIKSPIVVFCSFGDNITPPQQALGWILDLYDQDAEIVAAGQTIVYVLHQTIGHLGIFVSAKVATKEHQELQQATDLIDVLPPGLYEAVFEAKTSATASQELVSGDYVVRFEPRSLSAYPCAWRRTMRKMIFVLPRSRGSLRLHKDCIRPMSVPLCGRSPTNILRNGCDGSTPIGYDMRCFRIAIRFCGRSPPLPIMSPQTGSVSTTETSFCSASAPFSEQIVKSLDLYRDTRDSFIESWFMAVYGASSSASFGWVAGRCGDDAPSCRHVISPAMRSLPSRRPNLRRVSKMAGCARRHPRARLCRPGPGVSVVR